MEQAILLKGLCCPNCADKIERDVSLLSFVERASVNLISETLNVKLKPEGAEGDYLNEIKRVVRLSEPDITISLKKAASADKDKGHRNKIIRLVIGAFVFAAGFITGELIVFIAAYLLLGFDVILKALRNILKGRVFDENFLMTIATAGAFVIAQYPEAAGVMLFYQIGEMFQAAAVRRSKKSITELMDIRPDSATVKRGGELITVTPEDVSVGELIVISPGERIPLDGVITEGESMLDTKALTGEAIPRRAAPGDTVLSGTINQNGVLTVKTTKIYGESTAALILELMENASSRKAPTENYITTFSRFYTPAVVGLALLLAVIPPALGLGDFAEWLRRSLVFLVISCPCALVISIPLGFFGGIGGASRKGALVKGGGCLEALNSLDIAVFDKTGTLTKGVFNVTRIIPAKGFTKEDALFYAAIAESYSSHPIALSIKNAYGKTVEKTTLSDYNEIPGQGVCVIYNGKKIKAGNARLLEGLDFVPCDLAGTKVYVAVDDTYAGCIIISDEVKKDARRAVEDLKKYGVKKVVMLTGDGKEVSEAVAGELIIDEVYYELLPQDKVDLLETLDKQKRKGGKLAFIGDGINDAPVLARADIGIAMGGIGSDAAIEAADIVLMTDEPSRIIDAITTARFTKRVVWQNIVFALAVKGVFLILGAFGIAGLWEAVFADVGVALIAVINAARVIKG